MVIAPIAGALSERYGNRPFMAAGLALQSIVASGTNSMLRELGGVLGVAVLASVFARHAAYTSPQVFVDGFTEALWVGVGLSALGSAAALLVPGPRRAVEASAAPAALAMHDPIAETT